MKNSIKRKLSFILIYTLLFPLTACIPHYYTEEEEEYLEKKGDTVVSEWFKNHEPTATYSDPMLNYDYNTYGLSDVYYGSYTIDGETYSYVYVSGSDEMYSDRLLELASETAARKYAEGLGISYIESEFSDSLMIPIKYTAIYDKGNGQILEEAEDCFAALPYDMKEDEIDDYLDEIFNNSSITSNSLIKYTCADAHINKNMIDLDFIRTHKFINRLAFTNKTKDESIYVYITRDYQDPNKKEILRMTFSIKDEDDVFKKIATWDFDL